MWGRPGDDSSAKQDRLICSTLVAENISIQAKWREKQHTSQYAALHSGTHSSLVSAHLFPIWFKSWGPRVALLMFLWVCSPPLPSPSSNLLVHLDGNWVSLEVFVRCMNSGSVLSGHTTLNTPDVVWPWELSRVGLGYDLDGRPLDLLPEIFFQYQEFQFYSLRISGLLVLQRTLVVIRPIIPSAVTTWWWSNGWVSITRRSFKWLHWEQKSILPRDSKVVYYFKHTKIQKIMWYPYPTMCIYQILICSYICSRNLFKKEKEF